MDLVDLLNKGTLLKGATSFFALNFASGEVLPDFAIPFISLFGLFDEEFEF